VTFTFIGVMTFLTTTTTTNSHIIFMWQLRKGQSHC